jgi:hypothetical protein
MHNFNLPYNQTFKVMPESHLDKFMLTSHHNHLKN